VQEVAESVGFTNPAHFATAFRRKFGNTPSQQRRTGQLTQQADVAAVDLWMQQADPTPARD
jgi:AraC-like DNA-binding protein